MNNQNDKLKPNYNSNLAENIILMPYDTMGKCIDKIAQYVALKAEKNKDKELHHIAETLNEAHFSIMYANELDNPIKIPSFKNLRKQLENNKTIDVIAKEITSQETTELNQFKDILANLLFAQGKNIYAKNEKVALKLYEAVEILDRKINIEYLS